MITIIIILFIIGTITNNNITNEFINYTMEIDPEEVKRHLDMLGYTHVEPNLLDEFVKGIKV